MVEQTRIESIDSLVVKVLLEKNFRPYRKISTVLTEIEAEGLYDDVLSGIQTKLLEYNSTPTDQLLICRYDSEIADSLGVTESIMEEYAISGKSLKQLAEEFKQKYGMNISASTYSRVARRHLKERFGVEFTRKQRQILRDSYKEGIQREKRQRFNARVRKPAIISAVIGATLMFKVLCSFLPHFSAPANKVETPTYTATQTLSMPTPTFTFSPTPKAIVTYTQEPVLTPTPYPTTPTSTPTPSPTSTPTPIQTPIPTFTPEPLPTEKAQICDVLTNYYDTAQNPSPMEQQLLEMINSERNSKGLNEVAWDGKYAGLADLRTRDLLEAGRLSHNLDNNGIKDYEELLNRFCMLRNELRCGETLARSAYPVEENVKSAFDAYMNSPSHKNVILQPNYKTVGISVVPDDSSSWIYYSVIFSSDGM